MKFRLIFRIFYTSFYTLLYIILVALILIPPADAIWQSTRNGNQRIVILNIVGCYTLTVILGTLIYIFRLWTNRSVIAAIPKTWIPVEKGDVNKKVRKMIVTGLVRSATIAWDARPRIPNEPPTLVSEPENRDALVSSAPNRESGGDKSHKRLSQLEKEGHLVTIPPHPPPWGEISHEGWSSPTSPDLPNLQYTTVILELPNLIEAKAVSLAPPDANSTADSPQSDMEAVYLLQRPSSMGLRDYISHLTNIGTITLPAIAAEFILSYEYARFSGRPLSEAQFRELMKQFADLLRHMQTLDPSILKNLAEGSDFDAEESPTTPMTQRTTSLASRHSALSHTGSEGTIRTSPSHRGNNVLGTPQNGRVFSTAPATPATTRSRRPVGSRSTSAASFSQSRRPYVGGSGSSSDSPGGSVRSSSQGSVIKLSRTNDSRDLPYTLTIPR